MRFTDEVTTHHLPQHHPLNAELREPSVRVSSGFMGVLLNERGSLALLYRFEPDTLALGGFYISPEDQAKWFIDEIDNYLKSHYISQNVIAPMNGNTWHSYRLPLDNHSELFPGDVLQGGLSADDFLNAGYHLCDRYLSCLQTDLSTEVKRVPSGLFLNYAGTSEWMDLLPEIYHVTLQAFASAPWFKPIQMKEFTDRYSRVIGMARTDLMPLLLDGMGRLRGYSLCYNGYLKDELVIKTLATDKSRFAAGGGGMMAEAIIEKASEMGYSKIWHALMHADNVSGVMSGKFKGKIVREYGLFSKVIE